MAVLGSTSPIKSIQRGVTSAASNGTANVTINEVDLDKSFISWTSRNGYINGDGPGISNGAALTTSTNLKIYGGWSYATTGDVYSFTYWEVVEYV